MRWRPIAFFGGLFLFGVALSGSYIFVADQYCPIEAEPHRSPLAHLVGSDQAYEIQQWSGTSNASGSEAAKPTGSAESDRQHDKRRNEGADKGRKSHSWAIKFFCEAKAADIALVFFTWCLVIATLYLGWATLRLWDAGERQIGVAVRSARAAASSASAANIMAEITDRMGRQQRQETEILQRAYLSVEPMGIKPFTSGDGRFSCDIKFVNVGKLPAREVKWNIDRFFSSDRYQKDLGIDQARFEGNNVIAPGSFMLKGGRDIDWESYQAGIMRQGDSWLYVWGEVRYDDGFGAQRFTRFCHRYNCAGVRKESGSIGTGISAENARQHVYGNDAD